MFDFVGDVGGEVRSNVGAKKKANLTWRPAVWGLHSGSPPEVFTGAHGRPEWDSRPTSEAGFKSTDRVNFFLCVFFILHI